MDLPEFSIVIPVYNEAENIVPELRAIERDVPGNYEILILYDFDEDSTVPAIRAMTPPIARLRLVRNDLGRGVVNAIRKGFQTSRGWLGVVVTMADLSDPPARIPALVAKLREGCDVVAGSRYMRGGGQFGGPLLKRTLSRLAGQTAYWFTGVGVHDVTTNFRAYSRRLIEAEPIESKGGFELGLELTVKCHLRGWRVGEAPASWNDRAAGESRFRLWQWLPGYLRWYSRLLLGDPFGLSPRLKRARRRRPEPADYTFFGVVERPNYGWTVNRYLSACVVLAITAEEKIVLVRLARPCFPEGEAYWELPGGAVEAGEQAIESARRELAEETGYHTEDAGKELTPSMEAVPAMGSTPHRFVVLRNCLPGEPTGNPAAEGIVETRAFTFAETEQAIRAGEIRSVVTLGGLLMLQIFSGEQLATDGGGGIANE